MIEALQATGCIVETDAPLAKRVFWRTGGNAACWVQAQNADQVAAVQSIAATHNQAITLLGAGSNVLVSDAGVPGITLTLAGALAELEVLEDDGTEALLRVGAGLKAVAFLSRTRRLDLGGFGALVGVPGTIGGAVAMNAGTALGWTSNFLKSVEVATGGRCEALPATALAMRYRYCALPAGAIVTYAHLRGDRRELDQDQRTAREHLEHRKRTQPLDKPSCGSVFTNPEGDHAGRLVEAAGLKGFRAGGAQISSLHANFIVNLGDATADDVLTCIRTAWQTVGERFGVWMRPEVELVGAWPQSAWPLIPPT